jgi:predicted NodU family carbamoyl transferase
MLIVDFTREEPMARSILSFKPGHDGTVCALVDGELVFSHEAEKDSFPRHSHISPDTLHHSFSQLRDLPDVVATSGWTFGPVGPPAPGRAVGAGYLGHDPNTVRDRSGTFFGKPVRLFSSSHERSHILCAYGLSPIEPGRPVYALIWEGHIGAFYEVNERVEIRKIGNVLSNPGERYSFAFALADSNAFTRYDLSTAGKLMALAGFSSRAPLTGRLLETADAILNCSCIDELRKESLSWSPVYNVGVEHPSFKEFAGSFSDMLFERFQSFAKVHLERGRPLLLAGGCGLNCEWNRRWLDTELFSEVFVPPCANDTGSAIGTAVDAQGYYWSDWKVRWNVACGAEFSVDVDVRQLSDFDVFPYHAEDLAKRIRDGAIMAFVQGRCEMGPRALGNRSIIASPFSLQTQVRLNLIKQREGYRPIAPICTEEDAQSWFDGPLPSPYMLFFHRVRDSRLAAVTHHDGTARVQTLRREENIRLYDVLVAFKAATGAAVLCNTSLNFKSCGFINSMSSLVEYVRSRGLDGAVVDDLMFVPRRRG